MKNEPRHPEGKPRPNTNVTRVQTEIRRSSALPATVAYIQHDLYADGQEGHVQDLETEQIEEKVIRSCAEWLQSLRNRLHSEPLRLNSVQREEDAEGDDTQDYQDGEPSRHLWIRSRSVTMQHLDLLRSESQPPAVADIPLHRRNNLLVYNHRLYICQGIRKFNVHLGSSYV